MKNIKLIQVGLGPIGRKVVNYVIERTALEFVAAVDPDTQIVGKDLGRVCGLEKTLGITVSPDFPSAVENTKPDVAILTTVSGFEDIFPQAEQIIKSGISIVSTCEEMSFPWLNHPDLAKQLDQLAKEHQVSVLGTGVNPGFLMDYLPIVLTSLCRDVKTIKVSRIQDASFRRIPFQQKIGAGLTLEQFEEKKQSLKLRHVGLTESLHMIADSMGWNLDKTEDILTPVIAEEQITSGYQNIEPGMAAGVQQIGRGYVDGRELITLEFRASVGEKNPADTVEIKGTPDITSIIPGGVNGDIATCAITVNAVKSVINAAPGLRTMTDIPVPAFFSSCSASD